MFRYPPAIPALRQWLGLLLVSVMVVLVTLISHHELYNSPQDYPAVAFRRKYIAKPRRKALTTDQLGIPIDNGMVKSNRHPFFDVSGRRVKNLHRVYPVNCSAVFAGDGEELFKVAVMLRNEAMSSERHRIPVPSDTTVSKFSEDCDVFKRLRSYPTYVLSSEEEQFPLAFIILTHKNSAQLELLLRAIYQPHNVYAIHPDAKSPPQFQRALHNIARCFDNVFICSKLESVQYGGVTQLLAYVNCMRDLVEHPVQWRYVINQCGESFPLKTNLEMVQQLKTYHGHNDVEGRIVPHKLARFHHFSPKYKSVTTVRERLRLYPPPGNITLYSGNSYNTLSRAFVEYALTDPLPVRFLAWLNMSYAPEEHYWASMQRVPRAPGGSRNSTHANEQLTTFVRWELPGSTKPKCIGQVVRGICVMATPYLPYLARQPHFFANKFYYSFDPVTMQCLQELLTNRTENPELISHFFKKFPVKRHW